MNALTNSACQNKHLKELEIIADKLKKIENEINKLKNNENNKERN